MTENNTPIYAAIVTIQLPEAGKAASLSIPLAPEDKIPSGQTSKRLADCTLEELRQFAYQLEADVWETYRQISLLDLVEDEEIAVQMNFADDRLQGAPSPTNWHVLLPQAEQAEAVPPAKVLDEQDDEALTEAAAELVADEAEEETAVSPEPAPVDPPEPADAQTPVETEKPTVAKPVSLLEQINVMPPVATFDKKTSFRPDLPNITPSKARVRVAGKQLPHGHSTPSAVDIIVDEPALRQSQAHAMSSMNREVAGVLIGPRPEKQPDGRYLVHVIDTIVANHTVMQGASVTYTPESWRYLNDTLWERYPDETAVMVGWYHTHPGFGIFLSGMDLFIHQNFFTQIWHIAYVLDPRARTSGFFSWNRQKTKVDRYNFAWPEWASNSW